jgi:hypothetical protein
VEPDVSLIKRLLGSVAASVPADELHWLVHETEHIERLSRRLAEFPVTDWDFAALSPVIVGEGMQDGAEGTLDPRGL